MNKQLSMPAMVSILIIISSSVTNIPEVVSVGDKYPQLYKFWPSLFDEFGAEGKYIFIIRNIEDVASSFNLRAQNPRDKWPEKNDYRKAVENME